MVVLHFHGYSFFNFISEEAIHSYSSKLKQYRNSHPTPVCLPLSQFPSQLCGSNNFVISFFVYLVRVSLWSYKQIQIHIYREFSRVLRTLLILLTAEPQTLWKSQWEAGLSQDPMLRTCKWLPCSWSFLLYRKLVPVGFCNKVTTRKNHNPLPNLQVSKEEVTELEKLWDSSLHWLIHLLNIPMGQALSQALRTQI